MESLSEAAFTIGDTQILWMSLISVPLILIIGIMVVRWSTGWLRKKLDANAKDPDLVQMLTRAWFIGACTILVILSLQLLNVPLTAFAFVSGAFAIGVGFGAQNIINNFISGWILMWERPVRIGDFLEIGDMQGTVEAVNTRFTRIRRVDGVQILVPNSFLLENQVVNWTLIDRITRTSVRVGVAYGSDVEMVRTILESVAQANNDVLSDPKAGVFFDDFGDSALIFELVVWIETNQERGLRKVRSDLRFVIAAALNESDVVVAFPQRDIHVDGSLQIHPISEGVSKKQPL
ncbi:MAG: small-conductance mechanosensitive channel [Halieaceae bacterium]|jgi:small-conductance mechanosensitive channel